jgi:hypothetical protein
MERSLPAVEAFAQRMREELREMRIAMVKRGMARGELPRGTDATLVVDLISAPVQLALLFNESMDAASVDRLLDIVLAGAVLDARAKPAPARSKRGQPRKRAPRRSAAGKS